MVPVVMSGLLVSMALGCKSQVTGNSGNDSEALSGEAAAGWSKADSFMVKLPDGRAEEWYCEPDTFSRVKGAVVYRSDADTARGFYKVFSMVDDKPYYYNWRHGFYVALPEGLGYFQSGESMLGAHFNEFYNQDTTLVVSSGALFYDVCLVDEPNYVDTIKVRQKNILKSLGKHRLNCISDSVWIFEGEIDHSNPENPPADRFIGKWLLKKDNEDRECEMDLMIYYHDSLEYRLPEFRSIISQFPDKPIFTQQ